MRSLRKLLLCFTALFLIFAFISCGAVVCNECVDGDGDGLCDNCQKSIEKDPEAPEKELVLIKDGVAKFNIVLANDIPESVKQAISTNIKAVLKNSHNIDINVNTDGSSTDEISEVEILVGKIESRGEKYIFDGRTLGAEGYAIKLIDSKIVIGAGSEDAFIDVIYELEEIITAANDPKNVVMKESDCVLSKQSGYKVTALKTNGNDMRGYTLAVDLERDGYEEYSLNLQNVLYARTGYWFEIVSLDKATAKSLVVKNIPKVLGDESYKVRAEGTQLIIECAYDNMLEKATDKFLKENVLLASGEIDFKGTVYKQDISVLHYEDFGAVGDGETDDFKAIYDTHVAANKNGQKVVGNPDAEYYIFNARIDVNGKATAVSVPIRTETDWNGCKFIIDDRTIASYSGGENYDLSSTHIFAILPEAEHDKITFKNQTVLKNIVADGLKPGTTHIDLKIDGWDGAMMIIPYNSQHKVFRRKGYGQHSGEAMHEVIVIDKDGNVSEETPIMFEYTNLNYIEIYKLDPTTAITVGNATIETLDTLVNHKVTGSSYRKRGINVTRSYTVVHDVDHIVTGGFNLNDRAYDDKEGASANGMFRAANANHVTFKDCTVPGRSCYRNSSTYNFGGLCVNKIVLDHCIQSNFWVIVDKDTGEVTAVDEYVDGALLGTSSVVINGKTLKLQWGIGGTNYCKNMEYIDSQISRFDAHAGLYNGKIINSKVTGLELTGVGTLEITNTDWYQYGATVPFLFLRSDYGYHWDGDIIVKDSTAHLYDIAGDVPTLYIANHAYTNWYFGYNCAFPNITLDNFGIYSIKYNRPMDEGYTAHLFKFKESAQRMHLTGDTGVNAVFDYIDANKNGYIDEPLYDYNLDGIIDDSDRIDVDGDGVIGDTQITKESLKDKTQDELEAGIKHPSCTRNLNITKPPAYIKIINNNGGYSYRVVNTAGYGISNGGWYGVEENYGGFFGATKFIYGEGQNQYFVGTDNVGQRKTKTFNFVNEFYS